MGRRFARPLPFSRYRLGMIVRIVLAAVVALGSLYVAGAAAKGPSFPTGGVLVFACAGCPGSEKTARLFTIRTSGRSRHMLKEAGPSYSPAWSPSGRTVAFTRGFKAIWLSSSRGTHRRRLTRVADGWETSPSWAPNGKRLVFVRTAPLTDNPAENRTALWIVNADGRGLRRLLTIPENAVNPSWSRDGRWIAFNDANDHLFVVRADGTGRRRLGPASLVGRMPRWSPDGRRVAFLDLHAPVSVSVLDRTTGRVRPIFTWRSNESTASHAWSPDGKWLAVLGRRPLRCEGGAQCQRLDITLVRLSDGKRRTIFSRRNAEPFGIDWRRAPKG